LRPGRGSPYFLAVPGDTSFGWNVCRAWGLGGNSGGVELGKRNISLLNIQRLVEALGVTMGELMT